MGWGGNIPANGHDSQQGSFSVSKWIEEVHLQEAANERDGLLTADQIGEHLRNSCGVPHNKKCEDTDGIIHGIVETGIQS